VRLGRLWVGSAVALDGCAAAGSGGIAACGLKGAGEGRIADARSKDGHLGPPLVDRVRLPMERCAGSMDGCFSFLSALVLSTSCGSLGSVGGRRGSSKLEALSWDGITDPFGRPEQLEKR
jgi:hypothetical protein